MLIGAGLRYKNSVRFIPGLDEVMGPNVNHDFSPGKDFDMEFIFDLLKLLRAILAVHGAIATDRAYPSTMSYIHVGGRCCLCRNAQGQDERERCKGLASAEMNALLCR